MDIWGIIFPRKCFGCGKFGSYICDSCFGGIPKIVPICPVCRKKSKGGYTHPTCRNSGSTERLITIFPYKGVIKKAILAMKYKFAFDVASELAKRSLSRLTLKGKYLIIPLPLHRKKLNYRGFNQSEVIARYIAKEKGWKLIPDLLLKTKITKSQAELSKSEREVNVRDVFSMNPKYKNYEIKSKVILLDDVWTTGNTMKEGIKSLKSFGFRKVWGVAIAKSGRDA